MLPLIDPPFRMYPAYMESAVAVLAAAVDWWSSVDAKLQVPFGAFRCLSESLSVGRLASCADIGNASFAIKKKCREMISCVEDTKYDHYTRTSVVSIFLPSKQLDLCSRGVNADENTKIIINAERDHRDDMSLVASSRDRQSVQDQAKCNFMAEFGLDRVASVLGVTIVDFMTQSYVSQVISRLLISSACSHDLS